MKRIFLLAVLATGIGTAASCSKRLVARVNGETITRDEFVQELERGPVAANVLNAMMVNRLFEQEAKRKGVSVTDAEVEEALKKQKEAMGSRWDEQLKASGLSEAELKTMLRQQLLPFKLFISDDEARKYFEQNRAQFDTPATVKFRRVVLATKEEAAQVRQQILDGTAKFEEVARQKSIDPFGARTGGEIGPVPAAAYGQSQPQMKDILEKQPYEQISEPIPNTYPEASFQIVQVVERKPGVSAKFEDKRLEVYNAVFQARRNEITKQVSDLRAKATVEILDPKFGGLSEEWRKLKEQKPALGPESLQPPAASAPPKPGAEKPQPSEKQPEAQSKPNENVKSNEPAPKAGQ